MNGELKSKAAVAAAVDPYSDVTTEQAEQTLMDEAEKAGSPAYFFDPNAAPEEKAAAAHAVSQIGSLISIVADISLHRTCPRIFISTGHQRLDFSQTL